MARNSNARGFQPTGAKIDQAGQIVARAGGAVALPEKGEMSAPPILNKVDLPYIDRLEGVFREFPNPGELPIDSALKAEPEATELLNTEAARPIAEARAAETEAARQASKVRVGDEEDPAPPPPRRR